MTVMGEASPEVWAEELRRAGRVVFPVRRRPVLIRLAVVALVFGVPQAISLIDALGSGTAGVVLRALSLASILFVIGFFVWQLITQRPALTVDHEGIRLGRKRVMPWTDVGTIGLPTGTTSFQNVPVLPANVWSKDLKLPQDNVKDIPALAAWLEDLLAERRRSSLG